MAAPNSALFGCFAALAMISLGLKAWKPEPAPDADDHAGSVETILVRSLRGQGFVTSVKQMQNQSPLIYAARGSCRIALRDGSLGSYQGTLFKRDTEGIGPLRYLYRGHYYRAPLSWNLLQQHIEQKLFGLVGVQQPQYVPIALASSPSCRRTSFHLDDVEV